MKFLTFSLLLWFLPAGFIGREMGQSDNRPCFYTLHDEPEAVRPLPAALTLLPSPASTSNWRSGREHNPCAAAVTGNMSKHFYKWIQLWAGVSPLRGDFTDFLIFKHFFSLKLKRHLFTSQRFVFEHRFSRTESVPTSRRWRWDFILHGDCFLAFHNVLTVLSQLDFLFPSGVSCVGSFIPQMTSQWSLLNLPEESKWQLNLKPKWPKVLKCSLQASNGENLAYHIHNWAIISFFFICTSVSGLHSGAQNTFQISILKHSKTRSWMHLSDCCWAFSNPPCHCAYTIVYRDFKVAKLSGDTAKSCRTLCKSTR